MAFLKISSTNTNLSWVLSKKPDSGMIIKKNGAGVLMGFFPKIDGKTITNQYCVYFKDSADKITYKVHVDESYEYLSTAKYSNPRFINDTFKELFHSTLKDGGEKDIEAIHKIEIALFKTDFKTLDVFKKYFTNFNLSYIEVTPGNFTLSIETLVPCTLQYFFKVVNIFAIFGALNSKDYIYIDESLSAKYIKMAMEIDAPYFIRYLLKLNFLRSENRFNELLPMLNSSPTNDYKFTLGDSHEARIAEISKYVSGTKDIVDIGTGKDARYLKTFSKLLISKGLKYYAIEKDEEAREDIKRIAKRRSCEDNVIILESFDEFLKLKVKDEVEILCSEVLEHNELEEAKALVEKVLNGKTKFSVCIFTVPNKDFNVNFAMTTKFRHDDHKWEFGFREFKETFEPIILESKALVNEITWHGIGDGVNDAQMSSMLILENK